MEIFRAGHYETAFLQDSVSFSRVKGTVRGLHAQIGQLAQTQLLTVLYGSILDVIVTPSRQGFEVSYNRMDADAVNQVLIPSSGLHGFVTLTDDVVLLYKSNRYYEAGIDQKVNPFDVRLGIDWGISPDRAIVSEADRSAQSFDRFLVEMNRASAG